jgi:hypothetical protein
VKKFCLLILFFFVAVPSFSQNIETADEAILQQLWNSMSQEQKDMVMNEFLLDLQKKRFTNPYNELQYQSALNIKKTGKILAWVGLGTYLSGAGLIMAGASLENYVFVVWGSSLIIAGQTTSLVSIPVFVTGARKERKYKPTIAFSPNEVKLVMDFKDFRNKIKTQKN